MAPHPQKLTITRRAFPLARPLTTPQGTVTTVDVVVADISDGDSRGRAEGVPILRFGESIESVVAAIEAMKGAVSGGLNRETLQRALPPGAARNALDCALWDIDAKRAYCAVADLAGVGAVAPVATAVTVPFDTAEAMAERAAAHRTRALLKLELGGEGDEARIQAVRSAAPACRMIVDGNEGWDAARLAALMPLLLDCRVELIEQPLPAGADDALAGIAHPIPFCADESCRTRDDLDGIAGKYEAITIKLDKAGGLTEALAMADRARALGLGVMAGCMVCGSLSIAPHLWVAAQADACDLDGPWWLAQDRPGGCRVESGVLYPPQSGFWGDAQL